MKEMSRKNKSRNRKQDKKSSKIRSLKKYQIQQTPRKRVEYLVDCLHLPTDVVMGREISLLSGNSQMQIRNFKKLLVCKEDEIDYTRKEIVNRYKFTKVVNIVKGGKERQDSVYNGIKAISINADIVLTHDGARPFIRTETINKAVETVLGCDACVVGVKVKDTIKSVNEDDTVHHTPKRSLLW